MDDFVTAHNEDGRDFIRNASRGPKSLYRLSQSEEWGKVTVFPKFRISKTHPVPPELMPLAKEYKIPPTFNHFVMNLPASAVEFLDAFIGVYAGMETLFHPHTTTQLPLIHLHIFQNPRVADCYEQICEVRSLVAFVFISTTNSRAENHTIFRL